MQTSDKLPLPALILPPSYLAAPTTIRHTPSSLTKINRDNFCDGGRSSHSVNLTINPEHTRAGPLDFILSTSNPSRRLCRDRIRRKLFISSIYRGLTQFRPDFHNPAASPRRQIVSSSSSSRRHNHHHSRRRTATIIVIIVAAACHALGFASASALFNRCRSWSSRAARHLPAFRHGPPLARPASHHLMKPGRRTTMAKLPRTLPESWFPLAAAGGNRIRAKHSSTRFPMSCWPKSCRTYTPLRSQP
jgi:hypothetical protein